MKAIEFKAQLVKEVYYKKESSYGIATVSTKDIIPHAKDGVVTIVGYYGKLIPGFTYIISAKEKNHKTFGWQYEVKNIMSPDMLTPDNARLYLCSIMSPVIVDGLLKEYPDIVNQILNDSSFEPDYSLLPGIRALKFAQIRRAVIDTYMMSDILAFLQPLGMSLTMIKRIMRYETNGAVLKQRIEDNPYYLTKIPRLGFKKVDEFALQFNPNLLVSKQRLMAGIEHAIEILGEQDGNSCILISKMKKAVVEVVPECKPLLADYLAEERENTLNNNLDKLYVKDDICGLASYYRMERDIYLKLYNIHKAKNIFEIKDFDDRIAKANEALGFELSEQQVDIIKSIAENNVTLISGKAGTGKTSTIKGILSVYGNYHFEMCTLSARAARRIVELTGFNGAKTIHRLLEYNGTGGFTYGEWNHLSIDILIIDEASMINIMLFDSLLKALPENCKVIIVGDIMQLPPIGVGAVFSDLLNLSKCFNTLKLTTIYRQAEDSGIIKDANSIREGRLPFSDLEPRMNSGINKDMWYIFNNDAKVVNNLLINQFFEYINAGLNVKDVLIIVPRKKDVVNSSQEINKKIQARLISDDANSIQFFDKVFRVGDRVINTVNNYGLNVMNGEIGTVVMAENESIVVDFDDKIVAFSKDDLDSIELGYAITVHKIQGSSAKLVIIGLDNSHHNLLSSNLIYTAITRAERGCIVVAQPSAFRRGVKNIKENMRNTFLKLMLKSA